MNETQIDAQIVIDLLRKENEDLHYQLLLIRAQMVQAQKAPQEASEGTQGPAA